MKGSWSSALAGKSFIAEKSFFQILNLKTTLDLGVPLQKEHLPEKKGHNFPSSKCDPMLDMIVKQL